MSQQRSDGWSSAAGVSGAGPRRLPEGRVKNQTGHEFSASRAIAATLVNKTLTPASSWLTLP
jgi:hypothetical protein